MNTNIKIVAVPFTTADRVLEVTRNRLEHQGLSGSELRCTFERRRVTLSAVRRYRYARAHDALLELLREFAVPESGRSHS
jgi:hypothetical protein